MNTLLPLAVSFLATVQLMGSAGVLLKIWRDYPANHWAMDVRLGWIGCAITLALCVIGLRKRVDPRWLFIACTVLTAIIVIAILVTDQFNLLVQHGRWSARGMPGFGEF